MLSERGARAQLDASVCNEASLVGLINTRWSLIIQYVVQGGPFSVFLLRAFFQSIPEELFEAARIDGCGVLGLYWRRKV